MLSTFPELLFLSPFAALLLRMAAGLVYGYLALYHFDKRRAVAHEVSHIVGGLASGGVILAIGIETLIAVALIAGSWTQIAALIGFIGALKMLFFKRTLPHLAPLSRLSYGLLAVICLSLLVMGAGPFAFDLPL